MTAEPPNPRVQRTRSSPSARHEPLTRHPLGHASAFAGVVAILAVSLLALGCNEAYKKTLVGRFGLAAVDSMEQLGIVDFNESQSAWRYVIEPTVFAVGWDASHIIAKRHPSVHFGQPDKAVTQIYVLALQSEQVSGPYSSSEFEAKRSALGVSPQLSFTLTFEALE